MHEMSIASQLIETVLAEARLHGAARVTEVVVEAGRMRAVVPEAMQMAWQAITEGTEAQDATLILTETDIEATCKNCGRRFPCEIDDYICPGCGQADVDITAGNNIILKSLSCEEAT